MSQTSINRVTLVGNLTADPELRELPSGDTVCHMRLACNGRRRNPEGGYDTKPNYFSVSVFGPQSENVHRYLSKGRAVAIDGRLEWREWETSDQQKRQTVAIVANNVQFLSGAAQRSGGESLDGADLDLDDMELVTAASISDDELDGVEIEDVEVELGNQLDTEEKPELVAAGAGAQDDDLLF
jgi:single-strand DNA-binding protein